jgi:hypothetical protein
MENVDMSEIFARIGATDYNAGDISLPDSRTFRDAWRLDDGQTIVHIDMAAAREIWRQKIRMARIPKFEELDAAFMRAMETGADASAIVAQKQALRDAPADPAIDAASTPEELKLVQPAGLTVE